MPNGLFGDDDDDEGQGSGGPGNENTSFQELRAHARQLEKAQKAAAKELEELRSFKVQAEAADKLNKARSLGLTETQAKTFIKVTEGEVTPEAVQGFRAELGLAAPETEGTSVGEDNPGAYPTPTLNVPSMAGFSPLSAGGTSPVRNILTYEQYQVLLVKDPAAAMKAVAEKRVDGLYENGIYPGQDRSPSDFVTTS